MDVLAWNENVASSLYTFESMSLCVSKSGKKLKISSKDAVKEGRRYAYRAKNNEIMPPSTPAMREDCIGAGKSLAVRRDSEDPIGWDVCGASKDIFVTGSLSNISSVGKRRMILLDLCKHHSTNG